MENSVTHLMDVVSLKMGLTLYLTSISLTTTNEDVKAKIVEIKDQFLKLVEQDSELDKKNTYENLTLQQVQE